MAAHGRLLPKHYWNLAFLANWTGGTMGLYLQEFPQYFGDVPVRDIGLLASEGRMSIPIEDGTPAGILEVNTNFYEFVPADEEPKTSKHVLRAHEVRPGEEYWILLTTSAGFYRYDIGDVVKVVGFEGQAPVIEFLHKGAHLCSMTGEKLSERQVVLEDACTAEGGTLQEGVAPHRHAQHLHALGGFGKAGVPDRSAGKPLQAGLVEIFNSLPQNVPTLAFRELAATLTDRNGHMSILRKLTEPQSIPQCLLARRIHQVFLPANNMSNLHQIVSKDYQS